MTLSIFEIGHAVVEVSRRHEVPLPEDMAPLAMIDHVLRVISERSQSVREDLKSLRRLRREVSGQNGEDFEMTSADMASEEMPAAE